MLPQPDACIQPQTDADATASSLDHWMYVCNPDGDGFHGAY